MVSYQNIGTPRFYIDYYQYLMNTGGVVSKDEAFGLNNINSYNDIKTGNNTTITWNFVGDSDNILTAKYFN